MPANDIRLLLLRIKENIATIEMDGPEKAVLQSIEEDFLALLELLKLFLISERDTYYGFFLMSMQFRVDFTSSGIAGIKLGEYPPVFMSNPLLLCKFRLKEIIYIVCHEIEHVVLNHPAEMLKANPGKDPELFKLFNLAADASVNDRLDEEVASGCNFMKTPDGIVNSPALSDMFSLGPIARLESYRYYYDILLANEVEPEQSGPQQMLSQFGDLPEGSDAADGEGEHDGPKENAVVTVGQCTDPADHDWEDADAYDAEELGHMVREFVNRAVDLMNEETRGKMPNGFMSQVDLLNEPPRISWQSLLKKYVGTISAGKRKTRSRLNRRQPKRFDLSGAVDDKTLKIVIAIDTSGSVDDQQIAQIFNEIFAIIAHRKFEMTVIECDAAIQRVYTVKTRADVDPHVRGRGGTAFTPVIEYINNDRHFRDALLIYFTDGWGEWSIPRPLTYRNLWVLTCGDHLSVEEPYGAVITMEL